MKCHIAPASFALLSHSSINYSSNKDLVESQAMSIPHVVPPVSL
jgi:hypothetical protein